jgi:transposase
MKKQYTSEFKTKVVREILREQKTINQLAAEYGVPPKLLYDWRATALDGLPALFSGRDQQEQRAKERTYQATIEQLYTEIGKLSTQLAWVKKKAGHLVDED